MQLSVQFTEVFFMDPSSRKRPRLSPFAWLIIVLLAMLALGLWILIAGLQPPKLFQTMPYTA